MHKHRCAQKWLWNPFVRIKILRLNKPNSLKECRNSGCYTVQANLYMHLPWLKSPCLRHLPTVFIGLAANLSVKANSLFIGKAFWEVNCCSIDWIPSFLEVLPCRKGGSHLQLVNIASLLTYYKEKSPSHIKAQVRLQDYTFCHESQLVLPSIHG